MHTEIKVWILVGVAGIMATILGFIIKVITDQVIKRLDDIVIELKQLTQVTTIQGQQIQGLKEQEAMIHHRLSEHSERIHALERSAIKHP
jgi:L-2-hydroxyglutarate oxidase LhgO